MSQDVTQSNELGTLSQRTDNVDVETAAVIKALAKAKRVTRCIFLGALIVLVFVGILFYSQIYRKATSQETLNELGRLAQQQLENNRMSYESEVKTLAEFARPKIQEAFQAQLQKDMPQYQAALDEQRQLLIDNLQKRLQKKLTDQQDEVLAKFQGILKDEFPQIDDSQRHERMIANVKVAMGHLVQKYYVDDFREHLEGMYQLWDTFPVADPVQEGADPLTQQAFGYLLELLQVKLSGKTVALGESLEE